MTFVCNAGPVIALAKIDRLSSSASLSALCVSAVNSSIQRTKKHAKAHEIKDAD
jgi:hypothetical protein